MAQFVATALSNELELFKRFVNLHRKQMGEMISRMNDRPPAPTDMQCIRMCVEAVDMMLTSQQNMMSLMAHAKTGEKAA